ncbi:MAG: 23S rRNA (pseudouridine(1915)-N(3))-methyltransferase RlmH [Candidatus Sulfobium sp.]
MKIRLIWVGKTKEQFVIEGMRKYLRLLKPFADVSVREIKEEKVKDIHRMLEREGERILGLRTPYVLLDEKGKMLTSVQFAEFIFSHGPEINFVVGGAYGVSEDVKKAARGTIALSKMTFTHDMSRIFLLEQIYRSFAIMNKRGYHH